MMQLPQHIQSALDDKRSKLAEARRAADLMEAELRGFESALRFFSVGQPSGAPPNVTPIERQSSAQAGEGRGLSDQWRNIFAATVRKWPAPASLDDMIGYANELGTPINRNTLRSQASVYSDRGILERVGQGTYRLTVAGSEKLGIELPKGRSEDPALAALRDLIRPDGLEPIGDTQSEETESSHSTKEHDDLI